MAHQRALTVRVDAAFLDSFKEVAASKKTSVNSLITSAMNELMEREASARLHSAFRQIANDSEAESFMAVQSEVVLADGF